ncbi:ribonuclease H-like YkuK family protein [Paenibacillus flagellatus]|uniref:DUF458 domain-containing protein n=1 Tax=Paenibacillus flagellatus TaxID=2211139 RepID=A0A2V5KVK2_9BACL|nr:ribonuclease H-like YkuK family protein [Paenibacillus flagellatus]PYI53616.1 hypothetical protein DLM86_17650 [Paenibacillus flagellatus]
MSANPPRHEASGPTFQNACGKRLTLEDVFRHVASFMVQRPQAEYRFMIGTDCQAHARATTFVTGLVIQRVGDGAWACYRKLTVPRRLHSIRQKLSVETLLSEDIARLWKDRYDGRLEHIVRPYARQGAAFARYVDIDAGDDLEANGTAPFVAEMVGRVEALGFAARIKPDAVVASAYANRHTKRPDGGEQLSMHVQRLIR